MPDPTAPAATEPVAPAAAAPAPTPAPALKLTVTDVTPAQSKMHRVLIPAASIPAWIASIDASAPAGKRVQSMRIDFEHGGDLALTIAYAP